MFVRSKFTGCFRPACILLGLAVALVGCANTPGLDSVAVSPASQSVPVGQTIQFTATGTFGNAKKPSYQDVTKSVTWSSTQPSVATVNASGLATAVAPGTTTITASAMAFNGPVSASAILTVPGATTGGGSTGGAGGSGGGTGSGSNIVSLTIIPSSIVFGALTESGQFLAIATYSTSPTIRDVTNQVTWLTSEPNKFPVSNNVASGAVGAGTQNGGVVTAYSASQGNNGAVITAELQDSNGSMAIATASVGCPLVLPNPPNTPGSCYQPIPQLLSTLTVYNEGLNTTSWSLTAPSATGTANVIHCGPAFASTGSVCTATYPLGTTVTITAPATSAKFGGWSSNCTNTGTITATGPNTCTVNLSTSDATVGAIFN
jgi:hypothetical protein